MNILAVSPHPDDETLGCGGTLLRCKAERNRIYWLNLTNMKEKYGFSRAASARRASEIKQVLKKYRFDDFFDLGLRPTGIDAYPLKEVIVGISRIMSKVRPDTVILPYYGDVHSDHRTAFDAAVACTKIFRHPYVKRILAMEIPSETEFACGHGVFAPNLYLDISGYLDKKIEIAGIYGAELADHPFPRSAEGIRALAVNRGAAAGCRYAEAFMLIKGVE